MVQNDFRRHISSGTHTVHFATKRHFEFLDLKGSPAEFSSMVLFFLEPLSQFLRFHIVALSIPCIAGQFQGSDLSPSLKD